MKRSSAGFALLALLARPAAAHRLDEYLQASLISLSRDHVEVQLDLTPGVAVFPVVLAAIDKDRDGTISEVERSAYAAQVVRDLSLSVDGEPVRLRLVSSRFPEIGEMMEGRGVIGLEIVADLRMSWSGPKRRLNFENHHQSAIAVYLVNSLVPRDPELRITTQSRDFLQSVYRVDYIQSGAHPESFSFSGWTGLPGWIWATMLLLLGRTAILWRRQRS
jgi:hypothetical protein